MGTKDALRHIVLLDDGQELGEKGDFFLCAREWDISIQERPRVVLAQRCIVDGHCELGHHNDDWDVDERPVGELLVVGDKLFR